ncbi:hypothetical protein Hanom_Chr05g00396381 [Helianthus anomalus]
MVYWNILHWYSMYLYAYGGFKGHDKTAYFNPRMIHFDVCIKYEKFVIEHIKDVMDHHKERHYFMASHLAWYYNYFDVYTLFILILFILYFQY